MAIYISCRKDIDTTEQALMFFEHMICKRGVLDIMTTDPSKEFSSRFWDSVCSPLSMNHRLATAFHPQTDGRSQRETQPMAQNIRAICNYEQDNWVELLPLAEFDNNYSIHHSRLMTPFWANYKNHPTMQFKPPKNPSFRSQVQANSGMAGVEETHQNLWENIIER
jgi:hypothetical protein